MALQDPSFGVQPVLLPHLHLVSTYRYPILASLPVEQAFEFLIQAPRIVKEVAPMTWTYLQGPADGTVFMEWLPAGGPGGQIHSRFASDGFVWADAERTFTMDIKGYTLEILVHRSGYRPGFEQITSHVRNRYRIIAKTSAGPGPAFDPALWVVHYSQAEPQNRIPANRIPLQADVNRMMQERRWLENQGQLARKEFMLNDRYNWPTINIPGQAPAQANYAHGQAASAAAATATGAKNVQMGMMGRHGQFYPSNQTSQIGPSPAKRQRQGMGHPMLGGGGAVPGVPASMSLTQESLLEEEENTVLGDLLDNLTQEEISKVRYVQHHVWMEEILSSPYAMNAIEPADLGLGLVGELGRLTDGILDPPVSAKMDELSRSGQVSADQQQHNHRRLGKGQMEEFERRVGKFLEDGEKDLRRMKASHGRRLADMRRTKAYTVAERRLSKIMGAQGGEEQLDRLTSNGDDEVDKSRAGGLLGSEPDSEEMLKGAVNDIESSMGVVIKPRKDIVCIDKGGFVDDRESENIDTAMSETYQPTKQDTLPASTEKLNGTNTNANASIDTDSNMNAVTAGNISVDFNTSGSVDLAPGNNALAAASTSNSIGNVNKASAGAFSPQTHVASADRKVSEGNTTFGSSGMADVASDVDMLKDIGLDMSVSMPDVSSVPAAPAGPASANRPVNAEKDPDEDWIMVDSANADGKGTEQPQQQPHPAIASSDTSFPSADTATGIVAPAPATNTSQNATRNVTSEVESTPQLGVVAGETSALGATPPTSKPSLAPTAPATTTSAIATTLTDNPAALTNPAPTNNTATVPSVGETTIPGGSELFNFDENIGNTSVEGLVDFASTGGGTGLDLDLDNSAFGDAFHIGDAVGADVAEDAAGGAGTGGSADGVTANVDAVSAAPVPSSAAGIDSSTIPSSTNAGGIDGSTAKMADSSNPPAVPAAPAPAT